MRNHRLLRPAALLLAAVLAVLLAATAFATENSSAASYDFSNGLQSAVLKYVEDSKELNSGNFSMGFYNTVTGETFYYNPDKFIVGGSIYKIPLCMIYQDMVLNGSIKETDYVKKESTYTVSRAMELALQYSYQDAADALEDALHLDYIEYRNRLAYYCGLDTSTFPESYYHINTFSSRYMIGTLQALYRAPDRYENLIGWMKQANPNHYFRLNPSEYEIAQKYGQFSHCTATAGIIYTSEPVLLTVLIDGLYLESAVGDIASMVIAYVEHQTGVNPQPGPAATTPPPATTPPAQSAAPQGTVTYQNISVAGGIRLVLDGESFVPKNALGDEVDVFTYDGTTYLPVRALAEALGCDIQWDGETRTVTIVPPKTDAQAAQPSGEGGGDTQGDPGPQT